jgi:hypothetical protein
MTTNVYAQGRVTWAGLVACLVGIGITIGEIIGGGVAKVRSLFSLHTSTLTNTPPTELWSLENPMHMRDNARHTLPRLDRVMHPRDPQNSNGLDHARNNIHRLE